MKLAFIGLGVMGYPMAGHLQAGGHQVTVYNRSGDKAQKWVEQYGGRCGESPAVAAQGADIAFVCVGNDDDVRSVVAGPDGAAGGLSRGSVLVDHTTTSALLAQELAEQLCGQGIGFLDAPVSGGQAGAENGALTVMVGGQESDYCKVSPILDCYARCVRLLGPVGSGQLAKMVNQICIASVVQGLAEGLLFSERAGLDSAAVVEVIAQGAAQSWQMENRHETMLAGEYNHGFAVDWMRKDLDIVMAAAAALNVELPLVDTVNGYYKEIQAMGGGRWDTSSLFERLQRKMST